MKKRLWPIFSGIIECDKTQGQIIVQKSSDKYWGSYKINSVTPKGLLKTKTFVKKGNLSSERNIVAYNFSYHRTRQTSGNNFSGYTRFFDKYSASYMIIRLAPKKLTTKFFKTTVIVPNKKILANFSHVAH